MFGFKRKTQQTSFMESAESQMHKNVGRIIDALPEGIILKRISPRTTDFRWMARYRTGTEYYGYTVGEALENLFDNHTDLYAKFSANGGRSELL